MARRQFFSVWMYEVDLYLIANNGGRGANHYPDAPWRKWFDEGQNPEPAARQAVREHESKDEEE